MRKYEKILYFRSRLPSTVCLSVNEVVWNLQSDCFFSNLYFVHIFDFDMRTNEQPNENCITNDE